MLHFFFFFSCSILLLYTRENLAPEVWSVLQPPVIHSHLDIWIHDHRVDTHSKIRNLFYLPSCLARSLAMCARLFDASKGHEC